MREVESTPPVPDAETATVQPGLSSEAAEGPIPAMPLEPPEECRELAAALKILDEFTADLEARGLVGEDRAAKLLFLILVSRLLDRIVSAVVKGPSSAGKSFTVDTVLKFFPPSAYYFLTGMSEKLLVYDDEPLSHRILVIAEAAALRGNKGAYMLRTLLSEGRLVYKTLAQASPGIWKPRRLTREGPTGLILTTTAVRIHHEDETRMLSIPVDDSPAQTRAILRATAKRGGGPGDFSRWHALQTWLEASSDDVFVPYAEIVADLMPDSNVRLRRDFPLLLSLIKAHALLHRATREIDQAGRIMATLIDYAIVRELTEELLAHGLEIQVPKTIRETVDMVRELAAAGAGPITATKLATKLKLDKGTVSRRVKAALSADYLRNSESRKGYPMSLRVGEPIPPNREVLPSVQDVARLMSCTVAPKSGEEGEAMELERTENNSERFEV